MKLNSILSRDSRAALASVVPPLPKKKNLARRAKGKIPARLLAFNQAVDDKRVGKELRRVLYAGLQGTLADPPVMADHILADARYRAMAYKETPQKAVVMAATCNLGAFLKADGKMANEIRALMEETIQPLIQ